MSGLVQVVGHGLVQCVLLGPALSVWQCVWHMHVYSILSVQFCFPLSFYLLPVCRSVWGAIKPPRQAHSPLRAHGVHAEPPCTSRQTRTLRS